jgi:hypothetical protein
MANTIVGATTLINSIIHPLIPQNANTRQKIETNNMIPPVNHKRIEFLLSKVKKRSLDIKKIQFLGSRK